MVRSLSSSTSSTRCKDDPDKRISPSSKSPLVDDEIQPISASNVSINVNENNYGTSTSSSINMKYRSYKTRWVMLSFALVNELLNCLDRLMMPINIMIYNHWDTNIDQVTFWSLLTVTLFAIGTLPLGRAMDKLGIKRMARYQSISMTTGQLLLAATFFDEESMFGMRRSLRFPASIIATSILVINMISIGAVNAKVANDWFPIKQTTLALVIPNISYNLFSALASYLAPLIVYQPEELYKMGYIYATSAIIYPLAAFILIHRSKPKIPPSELAQMASETLRVDLLTGLKKVLNSSRMIISMIAYNVILNNTIIQSRLLNDILLMRQFGNDFCGQLLAVGALVSVVGSLLAAWLDMKATTGWKLLGGGGDGHGGVQSGQSVKVSRFAAVFYAIAYLAFNWSLLNVSNPRLIMLANIVWSFSIGLAIPLIIQCILRESKSMLPDASIIAVNSLVGTFCFWCLTGLLMFCKGINDKIPGFEWCIYNAPLFAFCFVITIVCGLYFVILSSIWSSPSSSPSVAPIIVSSS